MRGDATGCAEGEQVEMSCPFLPPPPSAERKDRKGGAGAGAAAAAGGGGGVGGALAELAAAQARIQQLAGPVRAGGAESECCFRT